MAADQGGNEVSEAGTRSPDGMSGFVRFGRTRRPGLPDHRSLAMSRTPRLAPSPAASAFDLAFRPASYFADVAAWHNVTGTLRRDLLRQGDPAALLAYEPELLDDESPGAFRDFLGAIRPELRSGEDPPGYLPGEVEIARLRYTRTVHQEVTAVRARPDGDGIAYRVVDEYLTEYNCDPDWSAAPLTLGELIDLVDGVPYGEPRPRPLLRRPRR